MHDNKTLGDDRRRFLKQGLAASLLASGATGSRAEPGVGAQTLTFGTSIPLTGPLGGAGTELAAGVRAAFAAVNRAGGVHGRELRLEVLDDAYQPQRTVQNIRQLLDSERCLAMVSLLGTPNVAAAAPILEQQGVPVVGMLTGAGALRRPESRHLFHVRASYAQETERVVEMLAGSGLQRLAVVYLDNAFGKDILGNAQRVLEGSRMGLSGSHALAVDGANAEAVADAVIAGRPAAVLLGTTGTASTALIKALRSRQAGLPLAGISVTVIGSELPKLGTALKGMALTQVMPDPEREKLPISRLFQAAMKANNETATGTTALEGWLNAQLLVEGLRRAGREPTRERLRNALAGIRRVEVGDMALGYPSEAPPYVASRYIELAVMSADGKRKG